MACSKKLQPAYHLARQAAQEEVNRLAEAGYRAVVHASLDDPAKAIVLLSRPAEQEIPFPRYQPSGTYGYVATTFGYSDEGTP